MDDEGVVHVHEEGDALGARERLGLEVDGLACGAGEKGPLSGAGWWVHSWKRAGCSGRTQQWGVSHLELPCGLDEATEKVRLRLREKPGQRERASRAPVCILSDAEVEAVMYQQERPRHARRRTIAW